MIDYKLIYDLYSCKGLGRVKINNILAQSFAKSVREKKDLNEIISNILSTEFKTNIPNFFQDSEIREIQNRLGQEIYFIDFTNELYPKSLNILGGNKPTLLSCIGNLELLHNNNNIGFCGSRKATEKGHQIAKDISEQVSQKKYTVVSGYASGVDLETHYISLKSDGSTIIVLPEGLKSFKIKRLLKDVWDWKKVLVISEYDPNAIWSVSRAMERNSTIVALSQIMILIEARIKGGSMDAGLKTLQFNKALFAPVYDGMPEEASGNQSLLEKGAHPLRKSKETSRANLNKMFEIIEYYHNFNETLFDN